MVHFAGPGGVVMPGADRRAMGHFGEAALGVPGKGVKPVSATYCWHWEHPLFHLFSGSAGNFQLEKCVLHGHYFNRYFLGDWCLHLLAEIIGNSPLATK